MSFNLPLILLILVSLLGAIWLYDFIKLRPARKKRIAEVENRFAHLDKKERAKSDEYHTSIQNVDAEHSWVDFSRSVFPVIFIVFVLRSFVFEPFQIPSGSMIPTLEVGDFIVVKKYAYGIRMPVFRNKLIETGQPKRGDVMVFFPPKNDQYFIKRVIGLPGDVIRYDRNDRLTINGEVVPQEVNRTTDVRCSIANHKLLVVNETISPDKTYTIQRCGIDYDQPPIDEYVVPDGHYFMMGDNRSNSSDSRVWGAVPEDRIVGKAVFKWLHWDEFFSLPSFSRAGKIE